MNMNRFYNHDISFPTIIAGAYSIREETLRDPSANGHIYSECFHEKLARHCFAQVSKMEILESRFIH